MREKEIDRKNPLEALKIAKEGEDAEERESFAAAELKALQDKCLALDDEPRWLAAMLSDTGARLAECTGLALDDIKVDAEIPHIVIDQRPWRTLKTKESKRSVPLVGAALWAARRVRETASAGQEHAFPRYIKDGKCKADSASATLNKWIRSAGIAHTCHELRHTMRDRLRDVQCPRDIAHAIGGWAFDDKTSEGDGYGQGFGLNIKYDWLQKVVGA